MYIKGNYIWTSVLMLRVGHAEGIVLSIILKSIYDHLLNLLPASLSTLDDFCISRTDLLSIPTFLGPSYTDNLFIENVSHYWLTLLVISMATYMPNFGLVR